MGITGTAPTPATGGIGPTAPSGRVGKASFGAGTGSGAGGATCPIVPPMGGTGFGVGGALTGEEEGGGIDNGAFISSFFRAPKPDRDRSSCMVRITISSKF